MRSPAGGRSPYKTFSSLALIANSGIMQHRGDYKDEPLPPRETLPINDPFSPPARELIRLSAPDLSKDPEGPSHDLQGSKLAQSWCETTGSFRQKLRKEACTGSRGNDGEGGEVAQVATNRSA